MGKDVTVADEITVEARSGRLLAFLTMVESLKQDVKDLLDKVEYMSN
jgi:hypothetical protein